MASSGPKESQDSSLFDSSRIFSNAGVKICESSIKNAGRGLAVDGAVAGGELILRIQCPLLTSVADTSDALSRTCDNCFAVNLIQHRTTVAPLKLMTCPKCMVVWYCNKECQIAAWKSHHSLECEAFSKGRTSDVLNITKSLNMANVRGLIRPLGLANKARITPTQISEIMSLQSMMEVKSRNKTISDFTKLQSDVALSCIPTTLSREDVTKLVYILENNKINIMIPVLRAAQINPGIEVDTVINAGACFDLYISLVNHSCDPNAYFVFEGREARLRARKDIKAGEEITVCYLTNPGGTISRKAELQEGWCIDCSCSLCSQVSTNELAATDPLREKVLELRSTESGRTMENYVGAIFDMKRAGLGKGAYPLRDLYWQVMKLYLKGGNVVLSALKTALRIFYEIELA